MQAISSKRYAQYKADVRSIHKTRLVRSYFDAYAWLWFHTEFWIKDEELRRPYTYIMRDWLFPHMGWFYAMSIIWFVGLGVAAMWWHLLAYFFGIGTACLWAHLRWGSPWVPYQQENPPYLGGEGETRFYP